MDPGYPHNYTPEAVIELHRDVASRYRVHGSRVKELWSAMDPAQRVEVMRGTAADGQVRSHANDSSIKDHYYSLLPEWNLEDMTAAGSDLLMRTLEYRATRSLTRQFNIGVDGCPGDHEFVLDAMHTRGLKPFVAYDNCYTFFVDAKEYGQAIELPRERPETYEDIRAAVEGGICISQSVGDLVLFRQAYFMQCLTVMIDSILKHGSTTRCQNECPTRSIDMHKAALSHLTIKPSTPQLNFDGLLDLALDQKSVLDDDLALIYTEPVMLLHLLDTYFFSLPEMVEDQYRTHLPAYTDRFINSAFFDGLHHAVRGAALWDYLCRLLELLKTSTVQSCRNIIVQEISNTCHVEYGRMQTALKRHGTVGSNAKCFVRIAGRYDNGAARVVLRGAPEAMVNKDQQRLCLLHLCHPETTVIKAAKWVKKLGKLYSRRPMERDKLSDGEDGALEDLTVIVGFTRSLTSVLSMPGFNPNKAQHFVAGAAELATKLGRAKAELNVTDYAAPMDNLLEPGMAEAALEAFEKHATDKMGSGMEFLYSDLVDNCIAKLHEQLAARVRYEAEKRGIRGRYIPFPPEPPQAPETRVQGRRKKAKRRPANPPVRREGSLANLAAAAAAAPVAAAAAAPVAAAAAAEEEQQRRQQRRDMPPTGPFRVRASAAATFSTLFRKTGARGSIAWVSFEAALAELGFSVVPKFGSVFTFFPPPTMAVQRPLTLHRPHKSHVEGYLVSVFARRLNRLYGWGEESFEIA